MTSHGRTVTVKKPPATLASSSVASLVASASQITPYRCVHGLSRCRYEGHLIGDIG
jgi:hypothetical protein